jgi:hypothetical protein
MLWPTGFSAFAIAGIVLVFASHYVKMMGFDSIT